MTDGMSGVLYEWRSPPVPRWRWSSLRFERCRYVYCLWHSNDGARGGVIEFREWEST